MANELFAGPVVGKREMNTYNDQGGAILNLIVRRVTELIKGSGITKTIDQTVVLFGDLAIKADKELKIGDHAIFNQVERSPRIFPTKRGEARVVDLQARGYDPVDPKAFEQNRDAIAKMEVPDTALEFTAEDETFVRELMAKEAEEKAAEGQTEAYGDEETAC